MVTPKADCHFHIIDPRRFPLSGGVGYHPHPGEWGTFAELSEIFQEHGIRAGLAVQPSGYGYDNRALLDALQSSGGSLKGIGVVRADCTLAELAALNQKGVVGLRFNLVDFDEHGLARSRINRLLSMMRELDMFVDMQCSPAQFLQASPLLLKSRVKILIDHCGRPEPAEGADGRSFQDLLRLSGNEHIFMKLSGPFRESNEHFPYRDMDDFVDKIISVFSAERCMWGSDWPFINMSGNPVPDYRQAVSWLAGLLSPDDLKNVFWDTPSSLFSFKTGLIDEGH